MSEPIVWENIPKSQADPQSIDEAIQVGIDTHNADSEAHMAALSSLGEHRDNPIIDHPAESVYNDKMTARARAHVAIVDPASVADFDTIEAAITYAMTKGGGTILITPGTHYLSADTLLPVSINLVGTDRDTCIVDLSVTSNRAFYFEQEAGHYGGISYLRNLTIVNGGGGCFYASEAIYDMNHTMLISDCIFEGGGVYFAHTHQYMEIERSEIYSDGNVCFYVAYGMRARNIRVRAISSSDVEVFQGATAYGEEEWELHLDDVNLIASTLDTCRIAGTTVWSDLTMRHCFLSGIYLTDIRGGRMWIESNYFNIKSTSYMQIVDDNAFICNNSFNGGTGNKLRFSSATSRCVAIGNNVQTAITNSGTNNVIANNVVS